MGKSSSIEESVLHLKKEGWCLVEDVVPQDRIEAVAGHVLQNSSRSHMFNLFDGHGLRY